MYIESTRNTMPGVKKALNKYQILVHVLSDSQVTTSMSQLGPVTSLGI